MTHAHKFLIFVARAPGYYEKRDCPGDGWAIPGIVWGCKCNKALRFVPDDPHLRPVPCEVMTDEEIEKALAA